MDNIKKNATFAEQNSNMNGVIETNTSGSRETGKTTAPGLDNRRTVGGSSLRCLVGTQPQGIRIERTLEADNSSGSSRATETGISKRWDKSRFLAQLEVAAYENETWIADVSTIADKNKRLKGGYESEVYIAKDGKNVIKLNNLNFLNDNDTQYKRTRDYDYFIERLTGHNDLFSTDKYQIVGFAENSLGEVCVIMSQPYVRDAELATMGQIDKDMVSFGFRKAKSSIIDGIDVYTNGVYELSDFKPENVLVDKNGDLRYIDLDIMRIKNVPDIKSTIICDNMILKGVLMLLFIYLNY